MSKKEYYFFTMNDFTKEGGGTIRMYSIMNSLAINGYKVKLYSNASDFSKFHKNITHQSINYKMKPLEKRRFQFLLSKFGYRITNLCFPRLRSRMYDLIPGAKEIQLYTFEYLDNSMGYWMFKNDLIHSYINDIHGVGTLEFDFQLRNSKGFFQKSMLWLKKNSAHSLDKKVLLNSSRNIYVTNAMRLYFVKLYNQLKDHDFVILNNLVSPTAKTNNLSKEDGSSLRNKYKIPKENKVILFSGAFKMTGGVIDLIKAFEIIQNSRKYEISLLLVGDGYERENCEKYVKNKALENIIFTGRTPYKLLPYFQALSDIIVCPDTDNEFSKLVIHVKYVDALLSNKVVINGDFPSVREISPNERLSLLFEPSNIQSLSSKIAYALDNYKELKELYKPVSEIMLKEFSYLENVERILK